MTPTPPDLLRGKHFRELHPVREGRCRYRYQTLRHIRFRIEGLPVSGTITFHDAAGRTWFQLDRYGALVSEGYAWNGCSPKRWVPVLGWVGTVDFEATLAASLVHDCFYQFHATRHFPLHRSDCDAIFRDLIIAEGEDEIARVYHWAVRKLGAWSPTALQGEYSTHYL